MRAFLRTAALLPVLWWPSQAAISTPAPQAAPLPANTATLEHLRVTGDLTGQRVHLWAVLAELARPEEPGAPPAFMGWFNKAEVFAAGDRLPFPGQPTSAVASAMAGGVVRLDAPVITFVHFNAPAREHVRRHRLFDAAVLESMRRTGQPDPLVPGSRGIPPWPASAVTLMSAWWPVAAKGITPLPVWDQQARKRETGSNSYVNWPRAVAVDPALRGTARQATTRVEFAGRSFQRARRIGLDSFFRLAVDAPTATRLMADASSRKAAFIALGRPLQAGDWLVLVAMHIMTAELASGVWGTFWWHDAPGTGPYAAGRPAGIEGPWRHLLMDVAFDAVLPREADGSPRIAFNPWFDAPFPELSDGAAHGNGLRSNCVNCHNRASYPAVSFLPVQRGAPDLQADPAYAPGRLRTGQVWSVAHAGADRAER
jgi:hypothetical protein